MEIIEERYYFWEFVYFHKYEKIMVLGAAGQMYLMWWSKKDYWALPGTEVHQSLFISPTEAHSCIQLANKRLHWDQRRHKIPVQPSRLVIIRLSRSINKYLKLSLSGSDSTRWVGWRDTLIGCTDLGCVERIYVDMLTGDLESPNLSPPVCSAVPAGV